MYKYKERNNFESQSFNNSKYYTLYAMCQFIIFANIE